MCLPFGIICTTNDGNVGLKFRKQLGYVDVQSITYFWEVKKSGVDAANLQAMNGLRIFVYFESKLLERQVFGCANSLDPFTKLF